MTENVWIYSPSNPEHAVYGVQRLYYNLKPECRPKVIVVDTSVDKAVVEGLQKYDLPVSHKDVFLVYGLDLSNDIIYDDAVWVHKVYDKSRNKPHALELERAQELLNQYFQTESRPSLVMVDVSPPEGHTIAKFLRRAGLLVVEFPIIYVPVSESS